MTRVNVRKRTEDTSPCKIHLVLLHSNQLVGGYLQIQEHQVIFEVPKVSLIQRYYNVNTGLS